MAKEHNNSINPRLESIVKGFTFILIAIISALNVGKVIRTLTFLPIYLFGSSFYLLVLYLFAFGLFRIVFGKKYKIKRVTLIIGLVLLFLSLFALISVSTVPYQLGGHYLLDNFNSQLSGYYKPVYLNLFASGTYWQYGLLGILIGGYLKNKVVVIFVGIAFLLISLALFFLPLIFKLVKKHNSKKEEKSETPKDDNSYNPVIEEEPAEIKPGFESDKSPFINENSGFDKPSISLDEMYESNSNNDNFSEFSLLSFPSPKKENPQPVNVEPQIGNAFIEESPYINAIEEPTNIVSEPSSEVEENLIEVRPVEEKPVQKVQINEELVVMQPNFIDPNKEEIAPQAEPTLVVTEEPKKKKERVNWVPPSSDILITYETDEVRELNEKVANERVEAINRTLANFKIGAKCTGYTIGPSITRFAIEYEPNVSVKSIEKYVDDLSVRLGGVSVRFTPVVFGESISGLEIPNAEVTTVGFKEIFDSLPDVKKHPLAVGFGKKISGEVVSRDYNDFPHMLVAGTTGSGKSIYIHSIIATLIMRVSPDDLKIVLVDPKRVEMTKYRDMPHLLCPIITDAEKTKVMLSKLVEEMENRYEKISNAEVSNIDQYNEWARENNEETMPYIIAVLDEYADLVDQCKEISQPVVSIAQKARAAGIHLLISTQRPSTNIITGVIKGNIPTHVALMTAYTTDSMVIIGEGGAEKLLGRGDMLVQTPLIREGVTRMQGCYIQNKEIIRIVSYLKERYETVYDEKFLDLVDHSKEAGKQMVATGEVEKEADAAEEARYQSIKEWVLTQEFVSMSKIQRECSVGFNRAGRFFKRLQQEGVVSTSVDGTSKGCRVIGKSEYYDGDSDNIVTSDELIS